MKNINTLIGSLSLIALVLSACTKEIPYEERAKFDIMTKPSMEGDYLMSSSMLNASRSSADALPFAMGDNKRVRFEWSETALRVVEMEKDDRFKDNITNNKLVMEIPVEHYEFECVKDKYGECTNTEAERGTEVHWKNKSKFKFKAEAAKSSRLEVLPILVDNEDPPPGVGACYEETSARVVNLKLESDAFNMSIERTFKINLDCVDLRELSDSTVTAVFHYSFVKTDSVLSKGFKTVQYPRLDEGTFGYFSTASQVLDADNNASTQGEKTIMNHWNPNRKDITYFLSDEFKKPEHKQIRQLTEQVVTSLNTGLVQAGAKFQINLKDADGRSPGDIRNSMIVLVEDPVASSIIGYGPQTEDPVTGEIVSARTVMFLGTIKKFVKNTYDDIIREKKEQKLAEQKAEEDKKKSEDDKTKSGDNGGLIIEDGKLQNSLAQGMFKAKNIGAIATYTHEDKLLTPDDGSISVADVAKIKTIEKEMRNYTKSRNTDYDVRNLDSNGKLRTHLKYLQEAKNCAYGMNVDLVSQSISPRLAAAFSDDAKPWDQLTDSEKQSVIEIILPEIWVPTLIHEMGHNLGLRHNFKGSEDSANYFSDEELKALNIDHKIPFSTVMEYGDDLKALPVLGKYDIAALRFAYSKQLELKDGSLVPVEGTIKDTLANLSKQRGTAVELKDYGFCTDEHTGINAGCRRFDLGVSLTEIVENEIKMYESAYELRNKRNGRADFSLVGDIAHAQRIRAQFQGMRLMQESYETIKSRFGIPEGHAVWDSNAFLKDVKTASAKAGRFLMSVVATPDLTCALVDISNPTSLADAVRLDELDASQLSCFDVDMASIGLPNMLVVGQYGKLFQSRKDPNSENSYADQIDVRGYWLDKMIATRMLFGRTLNNSILDKETDNFMDRQDLAPELKALSEAMLLNKVTGEQDLVLATGEVLRMDLPVNMKLDVEKPLWGVLARILGVPNAKVSFSSIFVNTIENNMIDPTHKLAGKEYMDTLRVGRTHLGDKWSADHKIMDIADIRYMASSKNKMARTAMEQHELSAKLEKVEQKNILDEAGKVVKTGRARLIELYQARKAGPNQPKGMTKEEKIVWDLGEATMFDYLTGALEKPDFFKNLLTILPSAAE